MANSFYSARSYQTRSVSKRLRRFFLYATILSFCAFYLMPLVVMVATTFKTAEELRTGNLLSLPQGLGFQSWVSAWRDACVGVDCPGIRVFYVNTLLITVPATILSVLIGAVNGFALTKFRFRGHKLVFGLIMFGCFMPYQSVLIPIAIALGSFKLSGALTGLVIIHVIYGTAFTTLFFRNYYVTVPQEIVKAAQVDGAEFWTIFLYIFLPLSTPMLVVSAIWQFTSIWNDFLFGSTFTYGLNAPIMVAVNNIVNTTMGEKPYNVQMASALLAAAPTILIYVFAGKYFLRGLMSGAIKG